MTKLGVLLDDYDDVVSIGYLLYHRKSLSENLLMRCGRCFLPLAQSVRFKDVKSLGTFLLLITTAEGHLHIHWSIEAFICQYPQGRHLFGLLRGFGLPARGKKEDRKQFN